MGISIPVAELGWRFSRSSGPGGQNVNSTDTRVELIFDLAESSALPETLKALAEPGGRPTAFGEPAARSNRPSCAAAAAHKTDPGIGRAPASSQKATQHRQGETAGPTPIS